MKFKKNEPSRTPKAAVPPTPIPPAAVSVASPALDADKSRAAMAGVAEASQVVEEARKRRGRPKGSGANASDAKAAADAELQAAAEELYSGENFEDLVTLPGEIGFALTGHEHWLPTERVQRVLARTGAAAARLMKADPRYLALGLFLSTLVTTYGGAAIKSVQLNRQKKIRDYQEAATKNAT